MGRELTGTGGGELCPGRFGGSRGGTDDPSKPVLGRMKAEAGGGNRRGPVGCASSTCEEMGVLAAGREGSRGGRLGRTDGSSMGVGGMDRRGRAGGSITSALSRSAASLAACASLSFLDTGSSGSLAWSKGGAITRRAAGESIEVVLVRDKERLEMVEI